MSLVVVVILITTLVSNVPATGPRRVADSLVEMLGDNDLANVGRGTLARVATGTAVDVSANSILQRVQLDPALEPLCRYLTIDQWNLEATDTDTVDLHSEESHWGLPAPLRLVDGRPRGTRARLLPALRGARLNPSWSPRLSHARSRHNSILPHFLAGMPLALLRLFQVWG